MRSACKAPAEKRRGTLLSALSQTLSDKASSCGSPVAIVMGCVRNFCPFRVIVSILPGRRENICVLLFQKTATRVSFTGALGFPLAVRLNERMAYISDRGV